MKKENKIKKIYSKILKSIIKEKNLKKLFYKIEYAANFCYQYNLHFYDEILEEKIKLFSTNEVDHTNIISNKVVFFDSFGLSTRGLAEIYLDALDSFNLDITYITYKKNYDENSYLRNKYKRIQFVYINDSFEEKQNLHNLFSSAHKLLLYITPHDLLPLISCMDCASDKFLINLTDHAFWIGSSVIDYVIEFRNIGGCISYNERRIPKEKIKIQPFYPNISYSNFKGFPNTKMNKDNTIFSGGALYKTIDKELNYYKFIEKILKEHSELYFWYAGSGETKYLIDLSNKFPNRVFFTPERKDLYEILKNVKIYISTYPMIGGLMTQFASAADVPPISIVDHDISSQILLKSGKEAFEYNNFEDAFDEVNNLLMNKSYYESRTKDLHELNISPSEFKSNLYSIIFSFDSRHKFTYEKYNINKFLDSYLERDSIKSRCQLICNRRFIMFWEFWIYYIIYFFIRIRRK